MLCWVDPATCVRCKLVSLICFFCACSYSSKAAKSTNVKDLVPLPLTHSTPFTPAAPFIPRTHTHTHTHAHAHTTHARTHAHTRTPPFPQVVKIHMQAETGRAQPLTSIITSARDLMAKSGRGFPALYRGFTGVWLGSFFSRLCARRGLCTRRGCQLVVRWECVAGLIFVWSVHSEGLPACCAVGVCG